MATQERRIDTPNPDLVVLKIGKRKKAALTARESTSRLLANLGIVANRPGIDRQSVFQSATQRPVFAYYVSSEDPSKIIREDVHGCKTLGQVIDGRFRAIRRK